MKKLAYSYLMFFPYKLSYSESKNYWAISSERKSSKTLNQIKSISDCLTKLIMYSKVLSIAKQFSKI